MRTFDDTNKVGLKRIKGSVVKGEEGFTKRSRRSEFLPRFHRHPLLLLLETEDGSTEKTQRERGRALSIIFLEGKRERVSLRSKIHIKKGSLPFFRRTDQKLPSFLEVRCSTYFEMLDLLQPNRDLTHRCSTEREFLLLQNLIIRDL